MLREISENVLVIPTTTRTREQFERIDLGIGSLKYSMVCNGGVLIVDGVEDEEWYKESQKLIEASYEELRKAVVLLEEDPNRSLDVRFLRELFVYTKSDKPLETMKMLEESLDTSVVDVMNNGVKIYVVPKNLSKGKAVERLKERLGATKVIAAGDSLFDISMLQIADIGIAPSELEFEKIKDNQVIRVAEEYLFSEKVMESVKEAIAEEKYI